jgi:diadenosine tetraphosphatase ApaH/serine/threonine PP2A family protein phosphatase
MYFVHGCPPDSVLTYLFELNDAGLQEIFAAAGWRHCFVGHTHELELIELHDDRIQREALTMGRLRLNGDKQIINIGSVGQPRDGDNRAKYVLFDSERLELEVRFVSYDIQKTANKIVELGFPRFYADRLW